jgi:hypothetical protein
MRPLWCCGKCPETMSGRVDCTCKDNPRCDGPTCPDCGHPALKHHGVDGRERRDAGCQINSMSADWCRCPLTATQAATKAREEDQS